MKKIFTVMAAAILLMAGCGNERTKVDAGVAAEQLTYHYDLGYRAGYQAGKFGDDILSEEFVHDFYDNKQQQLINCAEEIETASNDLSHYDIPRETYTDPWESLAYL